MNRHIESVYGKTTTWRVTIEDPAGSGVRVDLTGKGVRFSAKRNYADADPPLVSKVATNLDQAVGAATRGQADVKLTVADASLVGVPPDKETTLVWDLTLEDGPDANVVQRGTWKVLPAVDRP